MRGAIPAVAVHSGQARAAPAAMPAQAACRRGQCAATEYRATSRTTPTPPLGRPGISVAIVASVAATTTASTPTGYHRRNASGSVCSRIRAMPRFCS